MFCSVLIKNIYSVMKSYCASVHSNVSGTALVCQLQIDVGNCVAVVCTELQLFSVV